MVIRHADSDTAIILLHEIYGINQHMIDTVNWYHSLGYSVYCPNMLRLEKAFSYDQRDAAYTYFMNTIGFSVALEIARLTESLRSRHSRIHLVGFSIGATIAWLAAASIPCDGIICHYGSRIRDYTTLTPQCCALLIFAEQDDAFPVNQAKERFSKTPGITLTVIKGEHGFCDAYNPAYSPESAKMAQELAKHYLRRADL